MLKAISEKIVNWQINNGFLKEEEKKIYIYAYEIFLNQVINLLISGLVAWVFHVPEVVLVFLMCYIPLRSYCGGYHAPFGKAMSYLNNRTYDNELYEKIICEVMPIYYGISEDFTGGATLFYSPKSMTPPYSLPDWNFEILNEIFIEGIDSNSFRMFIYKDECIE